MVIWHNSHMTNKKHFVSTGISLFILQSSWLPNLKRDGLCNYSKCHMILWWRDHMQYHGKQKLRYLQFHKSFGHHTHQGGYYWRGAITQRIASPLVKSSFHLYIFFSRRCTFPQFKYPRYTPTFCLPYFLPPSKPKRRL